MKKKTILMIGVLVSSFSLWSTPVPTAWMNSLEKGESAFQEALDKDLNRVLLNTALGFYEEALEQGAPAGWEIFYNIGNIHSLLGERGLALYNYYKAQSLSPGKNILNDNISYVKQSDETDPFSAVKTFLFGSIYLLGYKQALFIGIIFYLAAWTFLITCGFIRQPFLKRLGLILLFLSLWNTGLCFTWNLLSSRTGVILNSDPGLYQGDSYAYREVQTEALQQGARFTLLEERGGWYYIKLKDGTRGWIENRGSKLLSVDRTGLEIAEILR